MLRLFWWFWGSAAADGGTVCGTVELASVVTGAVTLSPAVTGTVGIEEC